MALAGPSVIRIGYRSPNFARLFSTPQTKHTVAKASASMQGGAITVQAAMP
jgi:hypothetical protein